MEKWKKSFRLISAIIVFVGISMSIYNNIFEGNTTVKKYL